jgi:hypothetical protein
MPAHVRKGLITGAPAFNSGGLGLSIGSRIGGGIRHAIAGRAPDAVKISSGNSGSLSFYVNDYIIGQQPSIKVLYRNVGQLLSTVTFATITSHTQHPTYSILQNINNVFIYGLNIREFDLCGNGIFFVPLSKFIENVSASSFEITIPSIKQSVLNDLSSNDYASDKVVFEQSGNEMILGDTNNEATLMQGNRFFITFAISSTTPIQQARTTLTNYTGKTYKFELYTNESGAFTVNDTKYEFKRINTS